MWFTCLVFLDYSKGKSVAQCESHIRSSGINIPKSAAGQPLWGPAQTKGMANVL